MKCLLIQANGNNIRLNKFFKQPKYELYYKDKRIIDTIIYNSIGVVDKIYVAVRKDAKLNFDTFGNVCNSMMTLIIVGVTALIN
jgi:hypothetical protein